MFRRELHIIINRWQFWGTVIFMVCAVALNHIITCLQYWGKGILFMRGAYRYIIINNVQTNISVMVFTVLLPIISCLFASDIYWEEHNLGLTNLMYTRENRKDNIKCKALLVFLVTFSVVVLALLISLGLSLITFDARGHAGSNAIYLTLLEPEKDRVLGSLYEHHPYINALIYIFARGVIAACFACFAFAVSTAFNASKYVVLVSSFVYNIIYVNVCDLIGEAYINTDIMALNPYGSGWSVVVFIGFTFILTVALLIVGVRRDSL